MFAVSRTVLSYPSASVSYMDEVLAERVAAVTSAVDALLEHGLCRAGDDALLAAARAVETARRRLETFDHALVAELDQRTILARELAPSVARSSPSCGTPRRPRRSGECGRPET
jgi:hypothetical protein